MTPVEMFLGAAAAVLVNGVVQALVTRAVMDAKFDSVHVRVNGTEAAAIKAQSTAESAHKRIDRILEQRG